MSGILRKADITTWNQPKILQEAAEWVRARFSKLCATRLTRWKIGTTADRLEFRAESCDAVAIMIFVTRDSNQNPIAEPGTVFLANTTVYTGPQADTSGIWLYEMPGDRRNVFVVDAQVQYIGCKSSENIVT